MKLEQLNKIEFNVSFLTNKCYIGTAKPAGKDIPKTRIITGDKRDVTDDVLSAVVMIISNNNKDGKRTILTTDNGMKVGLDIYEVTDEQIS
ncbi:DUF7446 family protein [Morganella morganii]|uniref:Uncharacterized protein n=1 Tax=Morganella morganii TaxID=582 RepID=A0AAU8ZNC7_MORMO|nr:hypothetical protein [Morganella morganii]AWC94418.1 hypothetical protein AM380_12555 [Morganella morganii]EKW8485659.1 hypothetical protein [Morganella morganii]